MDLLAIVFRRGWRTSEFWVAVAALALVTWLRSGVVVVAVGAIASSYIVGRGLVKGRAARQLLEREPGDDEPRGPQRV